MACRFDYYEALLVLLQAMHYSQHRGRQTLGTEAQHSVFGRGLKSLGNWLAWFNEEYPETGSGYASSSI